MITLARLLIAIANRLRPGRWRCPLGGKAGDWLRLDPCPVPPTVSFRLIPARAWTQLIWPLWLDYSRALAAGIVVAPPMLAPPGADGVFFTDEASLRGLRTLRQFARRLSLAIDAPLDGLVFVIVAFPTSAEMKIVVPAPAPGADEGLTSGGAREWKTCYNISFAPQMRIIRVYRTRWGRYYWDEIEL